MLPVPTPTLLSHAHRAQTMELRAARSSQLQANSVSRPRATSVSLPMFCLLIVLVPLINCGISLPLLKHFVLLVLLVINKNIVGRCQAIKVQKVHRHSRERPPYAQSRDRQEYLESQEVDNRDVVLSSYRAKPNHCVRNRGREWDTTHHQLGRLCSRSCIEMHTGLERKLLKDMVPTERKPLEAEAGNLMYIFIGPDWEKRRGCTRTGGCVCRVSDGFQVRLSQASLLCYV